MTKKGKRSYEFHQVETDEKIDKSTSCCTKLKSGLEKYIDFPSVAVASTTVAVALLAVVHGFYYLKVFLNIYHLDDAWLNVAQTLFLIWNAINDPIFGYMQDVGCCNMKWLMNRRRVILFGGPFYALFFMLPWVPWSRTGEPSWLVGVHLIVCLFFYDAIFSLVVSALCGLFTELTTKHSGRVRVIIYMEVASLLATFIILPVDAVSKSVSDFRTFQISTCVVSLVSMFFFWYTGHFAKDEIAQVQNEDVEMVDKNSDSPSVDIDAEPKSQNVIVAGLVEGWNNSKGIITNLNFWCVVSGNFFHLLRFTTNSNFLAIYTEALVSINGVLPIGSFGLSLFYTVCNVAPKFVIISCWPLLKRFGPWNIMMAWATLTIVNSIVCFSIGRNNYVAVLAFLLLECIFSQSIWPGVYNIFLPDVIDEDMKINKRSHPFSTTIFTLSALITKPAQSFAPMIIVAVLNKYNYESFQDYRKELNNNYIDSTVTQMSVHDTNALMNSMFAVVCWFPAVCAVLEMVCFIPYKMKFKYREERQQ